MTGSLFLNDNQISALPDGPLIQHAINNLYLQDNLLTQLPESFAEIQVNGAVLDISRNHLKSLPTNFGTLSFKGDLHLSSNELEELPDTFGQMKVSSSLLSCRVSLAVCCHQVLDM